MFLASGMRICAVCSIHTTTKWFGIIIGIRQCKRIAIWSFLYRHSIRIYISNYKQEQVIDSLFRFICIFGIGVKWSHRFLTDGHRWLFIGLCLFRTGRYTTREILFNIFNFLRLQQSSVGVIFIIAVLVLLATLLFVFDCCAISVLMLKMVKSNAWLFY